MGEGGLTIGATVPRFCLVICSLIDFLCLGQIAGAKTKSAKCEVHAVLRFLMVKHIGKFTMCNRPVLWTTGHEL